MSDYMSHWEEHENANTYALVTRYAIRAVVDADGTVELRLVGQITASLGHFDSMSDATIAALGMGRGSVERMRNAGLAALEASR